MRHGTNQTNWATTVLDSWFIYLAAPSASPQNHLRWSPFLQPKPNMQLLLTRAKRSNSFATYAPTWAFLSQVSWSWPWTIKQLSKLRKILELLHEPNTLLMLCTSFVNRWIMDGFNCSLLLHTSSAQMDLQNHWRKGYSCLGSIHSSSKFAFLLDLHSIF